MLKKYYQMLLLFCLIFLFSCNKEEDFITDSNAILTFSTDTLRFDTVFTAQGSAVRFFKVYNAHNQPIKISKISIKGNTASKFRINVDGNPSNSELTDIEIAAKDSIYVFTSVTIDPDAPLSESPFIVGDSLEFVTNGNKQFIHLEAFGQNANYVTSLDDRGQIIQICNGGNLIWNDSKPYIIYGVVYVGPGCTLTIKEGVKVYVHGGLAKDEDGNIYNDGIIVTDPNGKIVIEGTTEKPVIIQADRLEEEFVAIRGQWAGILLLNGSKNNTFNNVVIKNSIVGVKVDSAAALTIRNSKIYNTAGVGIIGDHATINAENCLVFNNSFHAVQLEYGGVYNFKYCTLSNNGTDKSTLRMSNLRCLTQLCDMYRKNALHATFTNCLIHGSQRDALDFTNISDNPSEFDYHFENCIVRVDELDDTNNFPDFFNHTLDCINANSIANARIFKDIEEDNYHLDTLSIAEQKAKTISTILLDLDGKSRDASKPDIGCFEFQY
ncbi:MAG: right-handed parallel beta-helix repeat-containing protein [Saprospiraceae bacterium]|nr:right-handed parallel beta-helix repeat-containing protein [Saprospiraceae bacterium]